MLSRSFGLVLLLSSIACGRAAATPLNLTQAALSDLSSGRVNGTEVGADLSLQGLSVNLKIASSFAACSGGCAMNFAGSAGAAVIAGASKISVTSAAAALAGGTPLLTGSLSQFGFRAGAFDLIFNGASLRSSSISGVNGTLLDVIVGNSGTAPMQIPAFSQ